MKCVTCEVEINPQWKHAIDLNTCPFCGQEIMKSDLKNLLSTLHESMSVAVTAYPEELEDWLYSNFGFHKGKRRANGDKHKVMVDTGNGEEEVEAQSILDEDATNKFFERAEAHRSGDNTSFSSIAAKTAHLKKLNQKAKQGDSNFLELDENLEPINSIEALEMHELVANMSGSDGGENISNLALQLAAKKKNNKKGSNEDFSSLMAESVENNIYSTQNAAAERVRNGGGGKGSFRRS